MVVLLVGNHVVALKTNPGVHSFNLGAICERLLASLCVGVKTGVWVEVGAVENTLSFGLLLIEILVQSLTFSLVVFLLVFSILNFSLMLLFFGHC